MSETECNFVAESSSSLEPMNQEVQLHCSLIDEVIPMDCVKDIILL